MGRLVVSRCCFGTFQRKLESTVNSGRSVWLEVMVLLVEDSQPP